MALCLNKQFEPFSYFDFLDLLENPMPIHIFTFLDGSSLPNELDNVISEHINSEFNVRVSSLSLTLNKAKYPLAKIKIAGLTSLVNLRENNMSVQGKLMKINLMDMSPHGKMYREKLVHYTYSHGNPTICGKSIVTLLAHWLSQIFNKLDGNI